MAESSVLMKQVEAIIGIVESDGILKSMERKLSGNTLTSVYEYSLKWKVMDRLEKDGTWYLLCIETKFTDDNEEEIHIHLSGPRDGHVFAGHGIRRNHHPEVHNALMNWVINKYIDLVNKEIEELEANGSVGFNQIINVIGGKK